MYLFFARLPKHRIKSKELGALGEEREMPPSCTPWLPQGPLHSPYNCSGNDWNWSTRAIHTRMNLLTLFLHAYCYTDSILADLNFLLDRELMFYCTALWHVWEVFPPLKTARISFKHALCQYLLSCISIAQKNTDKLRLKTVNKRSLLRN